MRVNFKVRFKNPWFWVGVVSIGLAAVGLEPAMFTSWGAVGAALIDVLSNPFQLGSVVLAILAVFIDPTTAGVSDSARALGYVKPDKGE